ncbi:MAG: class I SAM-dependent methyltransferase, partial [Planctomycetota bacterium]
MLANRLRKRFRHLRKWARRSEVSCFRLYDRDIPEFPLIVDWYDGAAVAWIHRRTRDDTDAAHHAFRQLCHDEIVSGLDLAPDAVFIKERGRQRGSEQYERLAERGNLHTVDEHGLRFEVNLSDYLDTGLFLDHRPTRALVRNRAHGRHVLNLFAYTGSFTVHAAAGGAATTTTVDLSATYQAWTARNLTLNNLAGDRSAHRLI